MKIAREGGSRIAVAVGIGLFNALALGLTTDAPNWACTAVGLLSVTIVVWGDNR